MGETYEKRESLSELGDLFFSKGILFTKPPSAIWFPICKHPVVLLFVVVVDISS